MSKPSNYQYHYSETEGYTDQEEYIPYIPSGNGHTRKSRSNGHAKQEEQTNRSNKRLSKEEIKIQLRQSGDLPVKFESAKEVVHRPFTPIKWLIEDILPAIGQLLVSAAPKTGKSLTFLEQCKELAKTRDGTIVIFSLEDDANLINIRLRELMDGDGGEWLDKIKFVWQTSAKIGNGLQEQFEDALEQYPDCYLIITDTLAQVKLARRGNDVFLGDYNSLKSLKEFANERKICSILIHHTNKRPKDTDNPFVRSSGSTGLGAAIDGEWIIDRAFRSHTVTISMQGRRYTEDTEVTYQIGQFWETYKISKEEPEEEPLTTEQKILALFEKQHQGLSCKNIAELTKLKRNTIRGVLRRMLIKQTAWQAPYGDYYKDEQTYNLLQQSSCNTIVTPSQLPIQASLEQSVTCYNNIGICNIVTPMLETASQASLDPVTGVLQDKSCNTPVTHPIKQEPRSPFRIGQRVGTPDPRGIGTIVEVDESFRRVKVKFTQYLSKNYLFDQVTIL